jgi:hypothetical protein
MLKIPGENAARLTVCALLVTPFTVAVRETFD